MAPFYFWPVAIGSDRTILAQSCEERKAGLNFLRNSQLNLEPENTVNSLR